MAEFTPVNLITGFLGSGKTTLLQRLLADPALGDTAVLINEFGEVGLDHHLLGRIDETMVLLASGCLCCTIRGELASAIKDLQSKRERGLVPSFRRLMVESSGLADPFPILSTVQADPVLRHHFRLGSVVTTVDAMNGIGRPESVKQVAVADRLVLTKTDLVDDSTPLVAELRRINPDAPLWTAAEQPGAADLFDDIARSPLRAIPAAPDQPHGSVQAFAVAFEGALDWTMFGVWLTMLLNRHGARVLRVKGILNVAGSATPVAVHGVQHLVHPPVHMAAWPDTDRRSHLVFIVDGLDRTAIERSLRAFLAKGPMRAPAVA
ncbi:MAG TPA: GTP-binding protein [Reyranella sp.]|nr:GTP-binding protein [Reyranella sp.]